MTASFTNKMTDDLAKAQQTGPCTAGSPYCATDDGCGGHGTSYLYQSFPSYGTAATNDDGSLSGHRPVECQATAHELGQRAP